MKEKTTAKNKTKQKFVVTFLIILIIVPVVLFSISKKVSAQESASACAATAASGTVESVTGAVSGAAASATSVPVYDSAAVKLAQKTAGNTKGTLNFKNKECVKEVLRDVLKLAARRLLARMTESTVNWINTGFHGAPLFVENPQSFFKDIAKSEIKNLVNKIGYDSIGQPFGKSTAINIINSYKNTFEQNAQYSLSKVTNDPALIDSFQNNFSVGGWDGFLLTTQFPQNNYIGYNLMVGEEQARVLAGTSSSQANKVRDILEQGQGFLSPQTCPSNPNYNNMKNAWNRPTFKCSIQDPNYSSCSDPNSKTLQSGESSTDCMNRLYNSWNTQCKREESTWGEKNYCPGGLVNTTPGSVVANQIMTSLTSSQKQGELAAAMGNSLSAIFDALLNKFMSSGLNALSNKLSGTGSSSSNDDNFDYYGNTLGTAPSTTSGSGGINWGGPDQIIVLSTFKRDVDNAISNGNKELALIDGATSSTGVNELLKSDGILQVFENIWPKAQELDMCLPGPNIGWQSRMDEEVQKTISNQATYDAFRSTADAFKVWLTAKMKIELPSSNSYLNAVSSVKVASEQIDELTNRSSVITETLIKLNSIKTELSTIATEPSPGSQNEATLIRLKQRFDGMFSDVSNSTTVSDAQNKLADAKDKLTSLGVLLSKCTAERTVKGWANPGGADSKLNNSSANTEKAVFCSAYADSTINCDVIFRTNISDYKSSSIIPVYPTL